MESCLPPPSPLAYLVGEHARAVVQIQELQREVRSLLSFREHVLLALPHLGPPMAPVTQMRIKPHSTSSVGGTGGKSLNDGPTAVADSGFNSDKATSMGKSSNSSSGLDISGGARWAPEETDDSGGGRLPPSLHEGDEDDAHRTFPPLGSAEDELWQLLEVIQKKGTHLRQELEIAEAREREYGHSSDPQPQTATSTPSHPHFPAGSFKNNNGAGSSFWPHSLPGAATAHVDILHMDAWSEAEKLRLERFHLIGRLSRAEADAAMSHQRLLDLHSQLVSLADEKRRVEEAFRAVTQKRSDVSPDHTHSSCSREPRSEFAKGVSKGASKVHIGGPGSPPIGIGSAIRFYNGQSDAAFSPSVTVSVSGYSPSAAVESVGSQHARRSFRMGENVVLPRVLKVPIRDKTETNGAKTKDGAKSRSVKSEPKSVRSESDVVNRTLNGSDAKLNRVVIERERNASKIDGGLSMPASLLKGSIIKVSPNKQRISAILKEKDVLELQRQLLTTVMEVEVLHRQLECAEEEWTSRLGSWECEKLKGKEESDKLVKQNEKLKQDLVSSVPKRPEMSEIGISTVAANKCDICIGTDDPDDIEPPSFTVHNGPNVKYDVVVYEEGTTPPVRSRTPPKICTAGSPGMQVAGIISQNQSRFIGPRKLGVEKPPRKSRGSPGGVQQLIGGGQVSLSGSDGSFGRDSLGRITRVPLRAGSSTPRSTPRSSPATSMSTAVKNSNGLRSSTLSTDAKSVQRTPSLRVQTSATRLSSVKSNGRPDFNTHVNGGKNSISQTYHSKGGSTTPSPQSGSPSPGPHKSRSKVAAHFGKWFNILE